MTDELEPQEEPLPVPEAAPEAEVEPEPDRGPVLGIFAHPDDAEISSGGTLARFAAEGREVHLLILTNGDRGSDDPNQDRAELARTRAAEQQDAAAILGLKGFRIFDTHDGELENTQDTRRQVVAVLREIRPTLVVTCDPTAWFFGNRYFNHRDHRQAGEIALDSVFPATGNPLFFSELLERGLDAWPISNVWLGWSMEPNHHQDITGYLETKLAALEAHASQVQGDMIGFFKEWLPREAQENGAKIGVRHAEAFRVLSLE